jgi:hypothetical protein
VKNFEEVDTDLAEKIGMEMHHDGKALLAMMASALQGADKEKNADAIREGVAFCADIMAHKIAFQYAVQKCANELPGMADMKNDAEKTMLGFGIVGQACQVHQLLRESLKPFFQDNWDRLQRAKEGPNPRLN